MKKILFTTIILGLLALNAFAQAPSIQWQKAFGGSSNETAYAIHRTSDGGFAITGGTASNDGDVSGNHGTGDYWLVRTDSLGAISWQKTIGGTGDELANAVTEDASGHILVAGTTNSADGDFSGYHGGGLLSLSIITLDKLYITNCIHSTRRCSHKSC